MNYKNELNEKQYEAVTSNDQYLRIIAGAGSGKTRVLTFRVAYLIKEMGYSPYEILAITFTNKVAREMKERALKLLDDDKNTRLNIFTFHAWCNRFLRTEIKYLDIPSTFMIFDDDDQERCLKLVAEDLGYRKSDPVVKEALSFIHYNKMLGKLPSDVVFKRTNLHDSELMKFFVGYEKKKSSMYALDFDDLLIYSIKILVENEAVREKYRYRYKHILIDEFQDTNDVQYKLLKLLCNEETSIYVVGDPDQTIYTWRGANQKIILDIEKSFSPMKTIILNENYRSTAAILNASNKLISFNKERVPKDLFTEKGEGRAIEVNTFDNGKMEGIFIANKICELKKLQRDFSYKDVCVLYRSSYLSVAIENALVSRRIPYKIYGGLKFYSRREVKDCLAYFHILINEEDDVSFERIINIPRRKIGDTSLTILKTEARENGVAMIPYLRNIHQYGSKLKGSVVSSLDELFKLMDETKLKLDENLEAYSEVLNQFIINIGYYKYLEDDDDFKDRTENVKALINDVRNYLKEHAESNFVEYLQNVSLLSAQDEIEGIDVVSLMTVHTAKGLEFKNVFVIGMAQGVFPNGRALEERGNEGIEEERRLCYVAFTRAQERLYVSSNREYNYMLKTGNVPSEFLKEAGLIKSRPVLFGGQNANNGFGRTNNTPIYKADYNNIYGQETRNNNVINLKINNGITWSIGDAVIHKTFGEGVVKEVDGDIIVIDFKNFGKKTLMANHPSLSKK